MTCTNFASTMVTLLVSNPLLPQLDLSCLRIVSCGGSPLPPATVKRAIAAFGCPFFISYGMTETCGKISMSLVPRDCSHLRYTETLAGMSIRVRPAVPRELHYTAFSTYMIIIGQNTCSTLHLITCSAVHWRISVTHIDVHATTCNCCLHGGAYLMPFCCQHGSAYSSPCDVSLHCP